jgi:predicted metal-dependent hydrolase
MPANWNTILSNARSRRLESHPDLPLPVLLCPIRTARRMRLRLDDRAGVLKVTHPRGVRSSAALAWAASQKGWVEEQLERVPAPEPFVAGARIPVEGIEVEICWSPDRPRMPRLEGTRLLCGGPATGLGRRVELSLRRRALDALSSDTAEIAALAGMKPVAVSVGDARTRWGSCSSKGAIRYSWRLILAPPEVRRFVVAHEVAHLRHLDHGKRFKALEQELFGGDTRAAEALLRSWSPRLRRVGIAT